MQTNQVFRDDITSYPNEKNQSVILPPFWPENTSLWFSKVDAMFHLQGVTCDKSMFHNVSVHLDYELGSIVEDVLTNPPEQGRYDKLKLELIDRLSVSASKTQLNDEKMGNKTPSEFMRHLRDRARVLSDKSLRKLWSSKLPAEIQKVIAPLENLSSLDVATLADQLYKIYVGMEKITLLKNDISTHTTKCLRQLNSLQID